MSLVQSPLFVQVLSDLITCWTARHPRLGSRLESARALAETAGSIWEESPDVFHVASSRGGWQTVVISYAPHGLTSSCTCKDYEIRRVRCRHRLAVALRLTALDRAREMEVEAEEFLSPAAQLAASTPAPAQVPALPRPVGKPKKPSLKKPSPYSIAHSQDALGAHCALIATVQARAQRHAVCGTVCAWP